MPAGELSRTGWPRLGGGIPLIGFGWSSDSQNAVLSRLHDDWSHDPRFPHVPRTLWCLNPLGLTLRPRTWPYTECTTEQPAIVDSVWFMFKKGHFIIFDIERHFILKKLQEAHTLLLWRYTGNHKVGFSTCGFFVWQRKILEEAGGHRSVSV